MQTLYKLTNYYAGIRIPSVYYIWAKNKREAQLKFKNFYKNYNELYADIQEFSCVAVYDINDKKIMKS